MPMLPRVSLALALELENLCSALELGFRWEEDWVMEILYAIRFNFMQEAPPHTWVKLICPPLKSIILRTLTRVEIFACISLLATNIKSFLSLLSNKSSQKGSTTRPLAGIRRFILCGTILNPIRTGRSWQRTRSLLLTSKLCNSPSTGRSIWGAASIFSNQLHCLCAALNCWCNDLIVSSSSTIARTEKFDLFQEISFVPCHFCCCHYCRTTLIAGCVGGRFLETCCWGPESSESEELVSELERSECCFFSVLSHLSLLESCFNSRLECDTIFCVRKQQLVCSDRHR